MRKQYLKIHPDDNVLVALSKIKIDTVLEIDGTKLLMKEEIPSKHKFTIHNLAENDDIIMYGVLVGKAKTNIEKGCRISQANTEHATQEYGNQYQKTHWEVPDISAWKDRKFLGYHRKDGKVGTQNIWLVIPLVFCENRNVKIVKDAMEEALGYLPETSIKANLSKLISAYKNGATSAELLSEEIFNQNIKSQSKRVFENIDGIKFLTHTLGCGGTREDSGSLCKLLASYITHPNVGGATVLSLGCQNAQIDHLKEAIDKINPNFAKPLYFFEQQESLGEQEFIESIIKHTFIGLTEANKIKRASASLSHLKLGLECGGSDGFSGISANPALGYTSDLLVALGGTAILAEFPELNGVEQQLINRCINKETANKFEHLMETYSQKAEAVGSGFKNNPSPGNIKDGLITDAIKSAGAAKKGGTSPVTQVLDYTEISTIPGLNLLCTPGNDVESTTGIAGSGANIIVFTTGLGTPTGNPIAPVIKMSTNTELFQKMKDIIDFDAGQIIKGTETPETIGAKLLDYIIEVASGNIVPHAVRLGQDDFIPWKRGVSL